MKWQQRGRGVEGMQEGGRRRRDEGTIVAEIGYLEPARSRNIFFAWYKYSVLLLACLLLLFFFCSKLELCVVHILDAYNIIVFRRVVCCACRNDSILHSSLITVLV